MDCEDASDEANCDYINHGDNYAKEIAPKNGPNPLTVYTGVSILAIPSIDTVKLKFTVDYHHTMKWYDSRLSFNDLNNITALNALSENDQDCLWVPSLSFVNALGPYQTIVDDKTTGVLIREDEPLMERLERAVEGA